MLCHNYTEYIFNNEPVKFDLNSFVFVIISEILFFTIVYYIAEMKYDMVYILLLITL